MKITTVNYQKVFPLGQYINERIGVEIQVDPDESEIEALREAKRIVEQFHKDNNPQLYSEPKEYPYQLEGGAWVTKQKNEILGDKIFISDMPPSNPKNQPHSTIEAISSCTTLKVLQEFDLIVQNMGKKYPEIKDAYDNKLKELQDA